MKECNSIYILQYEVYPLDHLPTLWSKMCSPRSHHTFQVYINRSNQTINTININIMSDLNTLYKICCQFEQPLHFRALRVAVALQSGHHASYNWACHFLSPPHLCHHPGVDFITFHHQDIITWTSFPNRNELGLWVWNGSWLNCELIILDHSWS